MPETDKKDPTGQGAMKGSKKGGRYNPDSQQASTNGDSFWNKKGGGGKCGGGGMGKGSGCGKGKGSGCGQGRGMGRGSQE